MDIVSKTVPRPDRQAGENRRICFAAQFSLPIRNKHACSLDSYTELLANIFESKPILPEIVGSLSPLPSGLFDILDVRPFGRAEASLLFNLAEITRKLSVNFNALCFEFRRRLRMTGAGNLFPIEAH